MNEFASAFDSSFAKLQVAVETSCVAKDEWPDQVAAGVRAAFLFAAADPAAARVLSVDALAAGRQGFVRYDRMIAYFSERLLPGRTLRSEGQRLPETIGRALVGGVAALVAQRLDAGVEDELPALIPQAVQFVLTPYLGAERARKVASGSS